MADGDRQLAFTTGPVPTAVQVSGPDRLTPKAVNASFDGSGAAGDFLPCLIITGRTGHEVARIPAPRVAAGASAEVSWFPRVGSESAGGGDYVFVSAANESYPGGHHDAGFGGIPQDARHLVIEGIAYVQGDLVIQFNGGVGGVSRSVSETTMDNNGALSTVLSGASGAGAFVVVPTPCNLPGGTAGEYPARFKVDIPYYRDVLGNALGAVQNRSVHVNAWSAAPQSPEAAVNAWKKVETAGMWQVAPSGAMPAITQIVLSDSSGLGGVVASLYKVA